MYFGVFLNYIHWNIRMAVRDARMFSCTHFTEQLVELKKLPN